MFLEVKVLTFFMIIKDCPESFSLSALWVIGLANELLRYIQFLNRAIVISMCFGSRRVSFRFV